MANTPVLDAARLQMLVELDDTADFLAELRATFIDDVTENIAAIGASLQHNQFAEIARLAHKIKGLSSNLGLLRMVEVCVALERAVAAQNTAAAQLSTHLKTTRLKTLAQQLDQQFADALIALDAFATTQ